MNRPDFTLSKFSTFSWSTQRNDTFAENWSSMKSPTAQPKLIMRRRSLTRCELWRLIASAVFGIPLYDEKSHPGSTSPSRYFGKSRYRWRLRLLRLAIFTVFAISYVVCVVVSHNGIFTAPMAEWSRETLFNPHETLFHSLLRQYTAPGLKEFMPSHHIVKSLNALQAVCLALPKISNGSFQCDILRVEIGKWTASNLDCYDHQTIKRKVVTGTNEPMVDDTLHQTYHKYRKGRQTRHVLDKNDAEFPSTALLHAKLDKIAKKLNISSPSVFNDTLSEGRKPHRAPVTDPLSNANRNHHWNLAFSCRPSLFSISFKMRSVDTVAPHWWRLKLAFTAVSTGADFYRTSLHVKSALPIQPITSPWRLVVPIIVLCVLTVCLTLPALLTAVNLPSHLYDLKMKRGNFKESIRSLIDPYGARVCFTPAFKVALENLGTYLSIIGICVSLFQIFVAEQSVPYHYDDILRRKVSAFEYWKYQIKLSNYQLCVQVLYALFSSGGWHAAALVLHISRLLEYSLLFEGTSIVFLTLMFAFFPALHFLFVFSLVLLNFGIILFMSYGSVFTQFSTLPRSLWAVLLYTFSFGDNSKAEHLIHPGIEGSAVSLQVILLIFHILVVILCLNMFTTIVIDAYGVACHRAASKAKMRRMKAALWYCLKKQFGYDHQLQEEVDILGGVPGSIFMRATVPDESNPLGIVKEKRPAVDILDALKPVIEELERQKDAEAASEESKRIIKSALKSTDNLPQPNTTDDDYYEIDDAQSEPELVKQLLSSKEDL